MRKNIDIAGFTQKQRLDELERVKAKYSKKGYTFVNYTDHGMTKSFATFEIDEANIKQGSGIFKKIFLGIIVVIIVLIIIAPSDNEEKVVAQKPEIISNLETQKEQTKEESKNPPNTITTKLTFDIINSLKDNYNIEAGIFEDMPLYYDKLCSSDKACQIYAGKTQIQVIYKSVSVNPSSKVAPEDYLETCSASFIALTNANKDLAEDIIAQAFSFASKNGSAKYETLGVEFKVVPDRMTGLLKCEFFKP